MQDFNVAWIFSQHGKIACLSLIKLSCLMHGTYCYDIKIIFFHSWYFKVILEMKRSVQAIKKPVQARIKIPGSKSITNRALLLAALADGVSEISSILISDDTTAFINALRQLGVMIQYDEATETCIVGGCDGRFPKDKASIWCADAGTVARFLVAACASSSGDYLFDGSEKLRERPVSLLVDA